MRATLYLLFGLYSSGLLGSMIGTDDQWTLKAISRLAPEGAQTQMLGIEELSNIMKNPDGVISDDFSIPEGLWDRVFFWAKIYSLYSSDTYVIHDRDDLSIIYKVVDKRSKVPQSEEKHKIVEIINRAFQSKSVKGFKPVNQEERNIYFNIKKKLKDKSLNEILSRIRTQSGQKDFIIEGIKISSRYLPIIEDTFKEHGLPWELTRIPFVESSFNLKADSKVGARGIWQIMGVIGKKFIGVDSNYDERYSPFKASIVAAKLLKENYQILGTWPLAITAYNHGPGGLRQAERKLGTKDLSKIIKFYRSETFGFASQNFYSEFLAALYVTVYSDRLFGKIDKEPLMNFFYVEMQSDMFVNDLARVSMLTISEISKYNPELGKKIIQGELPVKKSSTIKLPARASYRVEEFFERWTDKTKLEKELKTRETK